MCKEQQHSKHYNCNKVSVITKVCIVTLTIAPPDGYF